MNYYRIASGCLVWNESNFNTRYLITNLWKIVSTPHGVLIIWKSPSYTVVVCNFHYHFDECECEIVCIIFRFSFLISHFSFSNRTTAPIWDGVIKHRNHSPLHCTRSDCFVDHLIAQYSLIETHIDLNRKCAPLSFVFSLHQLRASLGTRSLSVRCSAM